VNKSTIAVLIPTYNPNREFLHAALHSLQAQTYKEWTAFIHDDCSPNNETDSIIKPFLNDPRITYKRSDKRLGIGGNWNACLSHTESDYVAFLFQDDLWAPEYLEGAIKVLNDNKTVGFVSLEHLYKVEGMDEAAPLYDAVQTFRSDYIRSGFHHGKELLDWWIRNELTPNIIGEPCFVVMRREATKTAGPFLNDMPQFLDVEYWTRLLLTHDWFFLRGNFGSFRVHSMAASATNQKSGQGLFDRLRCFDLLIHQLSGESRSIALTARSNALRKMIGKFVNRVGTGKKVSAQGSGELKKFILRHPLVVVKAGIEYMIKGER